MSRANLWRASLLMIALTAIACGQEVPVEAEQAGTLASREDAVQSENKVLILGSTVVGGQNSVEANAARALDPNLVVEVVTDAQWATMTPQDFSTYRGIILGDAGCASLGAVQAAVANRHAWGPAINGNIFIAGTAPVHNGAYAVTKQGIAFAIHRYGSTGMYISLSCYYQNAAPNTHVELLEPFGMFSVQGGGCHPTAHIVAKHSKLDPLTDAAMSNWPCSVNAKFDTFPMGNFAPWSVAVFPSEPSLGAGKHQYVDGTVGAPYILTRGARLLGCGNAEQEVGEACDYGQEANGLAGSDCSATCQFNWCGNGILDEGETCDDGFLNGVGECPMSCRVLPPPPPTRLPPVARCKDVVLSAGPFCGGVSALIDDGSSDPDGDLVACVQSVTLFGLGTTSATVTCTDLHGLTSTCVGSVQVKDDIAPSISCPAASTFECGTGTAQLTPAEAQDNCGAPSVTHSMAGEGYSLGAARQVTWRASDGQNEATCSTSLTMVDTLAPTLALNGAAAQQLECGVSQYTEAGATASDVCAGDLSSRIAISNAVNAAATGSYSVTYRVADDSNNAATMVRTVNVKDTLAPSLSLVGAASMRLECGVDSFNNPGATAVDHCSGNLTGAILTSGAVNAAAVGTYPVTYSVKDGAGLSASVVRTVQVADAKAPVLTLNGSNPQVVECGVGQYVEAGATASDVCTGNLSSRITISGAVNAAVKGAYSVGYSVKDASNNAAMLERTVNVVDTKAPSITLLGSASMSITKGSTFVDPGATAADACSGNLTSAIVKTGSVNTAVAGTYTLQYQVQDGQGLSATVTRTVTVTEDSCSATVTVKPTQKIWPPNHKYVSFSLADCAAVALSNTGCGSTGGGNNPIDSMGTILSIYSDEAEDSSGNGDGNTVDDIVITGKSTFKVRAERQGGGNGRVYGVKFKVTDASGNVQTAMCKFAVPHDQGQGNQAIDNGAAAGYTLNAPTWLAAQ
jgi:hypothetical protein